MGEAVDEATGVADAGVGKSDARGERGGDQGQPRQAA